MGMILCLSRLSHKDPIIIEMAMLWIRSNMASEIFKFESVDNGRRRRLMKTDVDGRRRTDGGPSAQVS